MAQIDGGDLVARMLKREGIDTIFTLSGGHIQNIYDGCIDEGIRVIDTRHEQSAGHAAEGYGRLTRKCGVAVVTAGPGVTDVVTAVATAYQNASPMLVIGGAAPLRTSLMGALQEIPGTVEMMKPITKWAATIPFTNRIPDYLAQAFRIALTGRYGPVFLEIPSDILFGRLEEEQAPLPEGYRTEGRTQGDFKLIKEAAKLLAGAERPVVMGGTGVYWADAGDALQRTGREGRRADLSQRHGPRHRAAGPPSVHEPHAAHRVNRNRRSALRRDDDRLPPRLRAAHQPGREGDLDRHRSERARAQPRHRHRHRGRPAERAAADHGRAGRAHGAARRLDRQAARRRDEGDGAAAEVAALGCLDPIHPLRLCNEMAKFVDDETIVVGDGGDIVGLSSQVLPVNQPGQFMGPGPLGTLGVGTGFCMAAQRRASRTRRS